MELRHLRYFVAVAEELHFTRAAARLNVAQPALSYHVQQLERDLGVDLFVRSRQGVRMTPAGSAFLGQARRVLDEAERARQLARSAERGDAGSLSVGFVSMAAHEIVPRIVHAFRLRHPHVELRLNEVGIASQVQHLLKGDLDVGLLHVTDDHAALALAVLRRELLVAVLPEGHPLAKRRRLSLTDLAGERFIMGSLTSAAGGFVAYVQKLCVQAGFTPDVVQEASGGAVPQVALVAAGIGVAIVPESTERFRTPHVVYRRLSDRNSVVDFAACWRRDRFSPAVAEFVDVARSFMPP